MPPVGDIYVQVNNVLEESFAKECLSLMLSLAMSLTVYFHIAVSPRAEQLVTVYLVPMW